MEISAFIDEDPVIQDFLRKKSSVFDSYDSGRKMQANHKNIPQQNKPLSKPVFFESVRKNDNCFTPSRIRRAFSSSHDFHLSILKKNSTHQSHLTPQRILAVTQIHKISQPTTHLKTMSSSFFKAQHNRSRSLNVQQQLLQERETSLKIKKQILTLSSSNLARISRKTFTKLPGNHKMVQRNGMLSGNKMLGLFSEKHSLMCLRPKTVQSLLSEKSTRKIKSGREKLRMLMVENPFTDKAPGYSEYI